MKILHINDHYTNQGGVEQYVLSVADLLAKHGHTNIMAYCQPHPATIQDGPYPAYYIGATEQANGTSLEAIVTAERPDVTYIHHVSSPHVVKRVSRLLPAVAYLHGFAAVCPGLAKYFRRGDSVCTRPFGAGCLPMHYLRRCSAARNPQTIRRLMVNTAELHEAFQSIPQLLVASSYMRSLFVQNGFAPERLTVLAPHFLAGEEQLIFQPPEEHGSLLFVGRLEIEKGLPYLLRALRHVSRTVRLRIAGVGTLHAQYERIVMSLGLSDRVEFLGWLVGAELRHEYLKSSLLVMPSICPEAFGKAGLEALTHGRPVVAFAVGGVGDWLEDGRNGFLVKPRDIQDLGSKLEYLAQNNAEGLRMGQYGQRLVFEHYTANEHLAALLGIFQSVSVAA